MDIQSLFDVKDRVRRAVACGSIATAWTDRARSCSSLEGVGGWARWSACSVLAHNPVGM
jgi:hypothetical protein